MRIKGYCWTLLLLMGIAFPLQRGYSQQTVGLFEYLPNSFDGYTLVAPVTSRESYLIDNCGRQVHRWTSGYKPGLVTKLLPGGRLLRSCALNSSHFHVGGAGGRVEILDWEGNVTWYYNYNNAQHRQHHDAMMLPNGNVMLLAWEWKSGAEAIAAGRAPAYVADSLWPETLIEIEPTTPGNGNIVWEWHLWDHLVQEVDPAQANYGNIANNPGLLDVNYYNSPAGPAGFADFMHCNAIDYNAARDEIILSSHNYSEFYILDHSTTTAEAASHTGGNRGKGGDFLYRWGNPEVYHRASLTAQQRLWWQHDPHWIDEGLPGEGHILIFNNGNGRPGGSHSTVDEMAIPRDSLGNFYLETSGAYGPVQALWSYAFDPVGSAFSAFISGAQRLPNGNTLICRGPEGIFLEIDTTLNLVWHYVNPITTLGPVTQGSMGNNETFRAYRFAPDAPELQGRALVPGERLEVDPLPLPTICPAVPVDADSEPEWPRAGPNPFSEVLVLQMPAGATTTVQILDAQGKEMYSAKLRLLQESINTSTWPSGIYCLKRAGISTTLKLVKY